MMFNPWVLLIAAGVFLASVGGAAWKGYSLGVERTDIKWQTVIAKDKADWEKRQRAAEEEANNQINALMNEKEADDALIAELRMQALADPAAIGCGLSAPSLLRIGRVR